MKKVFLLALCVTVATTVFCSCANEDVVVISSESQQTVEDNVNEESEEIAQIANPWLTIKDIDEANKLAGTKVKLPDGYSPVEYRVIESEYIEIVFSEGYVVRAAKTDGPEDISGDYNVYSEMTGSVISEIDITQHSNSLDKLNMATWYADGYSYAFISENDMDRQMAMDIIEAFVVENTMLF